MLDEIKRQHAGFIQQRDLMQNNLNQVVGAIFACEVMIKKFEEMEPKEGNSDKQQEDDGA